MYLSNRDIKWAIDQGNLTIDPTPEALGAGYDATSVDLHLGGIDQVKVWDIDKFSKQRSTSGSGPELHLGAFNWGELSEEFLIPPPNEDEVPGALVFARGKHIIVKPQGFLLWKTKEVVGTPIENPNLISFVNAKSSRARVGLIVHMTAPTIQSAWRDRITLEITNLGPFHFVLKENDAISQLTVATISSPPDPKLKTPSTTQPGSPTPKLKRK